MKKIFYCPSCMEGQISSAAFCPVCKNPLNIENAEHQLPAGTLLKDRYLVGKVLGEGGFGITYIGRDLTLDVKVAIKEYYPSAVANRYHTKSLDVSVSQKEQSVFFEQGKDKFLTEARTLAKFPDESNIVGVRDFFQDNNTAYIIMEFLEGISLAQHLREQGQLPFDELYALLEPVMDALEKVHGQGLIHRDISPANLMLLKSGSVKLLDFGTARAVAYSGEKSLSVIRKPGYAPEEQYRSHGAQGPWTDVYALCATIYKLITGATPENAMNRLYEDTLVHPSALGADISPAQETVLMRGLAIRQNDRIQSMHELKREFLAASAQQETSVPEDDDERTLFAPKKNAAVTPKSTADRPQEPSRLSEDTSLSGTRS
ncbi:MAG: serine/threonine protein kinase, partial [Clostridiales bacterium]|nr:serine/threonine protein kinase [Clostridiales bacterium]